MKTKLFAINLIVLIAFLLMGTVALAWDGTDDPRYRGPAITPTPDIYPVAGGEPDTGRRPAPPLPTSYPPPSTDPYPGPVVYVPTPTDYNPTPTSPPEMP